MNVLNTLALVGFIVLVLILSRYMRGNQEGWVTVCVDEHKVVQQCSYQLQALHIPVRVTLQRGSPLQHLIYNKKDLTAELKVKAEDEQKAKEALERLP
ncbi:hypothetical protein [Caldalkalibacillus salinus]|uniref:hypothetical protein n=1 Tax=Caldalkalibacillus salinus TaxID=2803787 RepID=UPI001920C351|nr:hypothetical protein [Caldalkalibacillus salinus]